MVIKFLGLDGFALMELLVALPAQPTLSTKQSQRQPDVLGTTQSYGLRKYILNLGFRIDNNLNGKFLCLCVNTTELVNMESWCVRFSEDYILL